MTMREFKIGQYVCYQRHKAEGRFTVIRLLPQPKGEPRYVIRSEEDPRIHGRGEGTPHASGWAMNAPFCAARRSAVASP
jgi:hypothetical protein